jgi:hypothetical protein
MVYIINNYDGSQLVGINDQTVNSTATSLRLPGRDYKPYGEVIVENLVWMLQHFSGTTPPLRAVEGQVWYDSGLKVLKVYDRNQWLTVGKASVGDQLPASGQDGQLFYHTTRKQAYVWDFSTWRLIAPVGAADGDDPVPTAQTNHTQWEALRVSDSGGGGHSVLKLVLNGTATQATLATNSTNLGGVPGTSYMRLDQTNVPTASGLSLGSPSSPYLSIHATTFDGNATSATSAASSANATQLNGQAASYYLDATNINAGTLNVARLPYTPVNKAGDTMTGTLTLNADPVAALQPTTKQYVDAIAATIPPNLTYTTGVVQASPFQNTTAGPDFNLNYFDLPPPVGKTVANLVAFIPSIHAIYFAGNVNFDDSLHCQWQIVGANIRIWVFNTEQRLAPSANYLAIWN